MKRPVIASYKHKTHSTHDKKKKKKQKKNNRICRGFAICSLIYTVTNNFNEYLQPTDACQYKFPEIWLLTDVCHQRLPYFFSYGTPTHSILYKSLTIFTPTFIQIRGIVRPGEEIKNHFYYMMPLV